MTIDEILLHPISRRQLLNYSQQPSQALLLVGAPGSGRATVAGIIAADLCPDDAYIRLIEPVDGRAIPIETIRGLQHFLGLAVPGRGRDVSRIVIIDQAGLLTIESQNALLKMLEEPPLGTIFILIADSPGAVLPTILSRCQVLTLLPVSVTETEVYFTAAGYPAPDIRTAINISGGLPALTRLLLSDADHPLSLAVTQARGLLGSKAYGRLLTVDSLVKQKPVLIDVIRVLGIMSRAALVRSNDRAAADKWLKIQKACYVAERRLQRNCQAKPVLDTLLLSF